MDENTSTKRKRGVSDSFPSTNDDKKTTIVNNVIPLKWDDATIEGLVTTVAKKLKTIEDEKKTKSRTRIIGPSSLVQIINTANTGLNQWLFGETTPFVRMCQRVRTILNGSMDPIVKYSENKQNFVYRTYKFMVCFPHSVSSKQLIEIYNIPDIVYIRLEAGEFRENGVVKHGLVIYLVETKSARREKEYADLASKNFKVYNEKIKALHEKKKLSSEVKSQIGEDIYNAVLFIDATEKKENTQKNNSHKVEYKYNLSKTDFLRIRNVAHKDGLFTKETYWHLESPIEYQVVANLVAMPAVIDVHLSVDPGEPKCILGQINKS